MSSFDSLSHHIGHTDLTNIFQIRHWLMSSSAHLANHIGHTDPWFQYLLLATLAHKFF